MLENLNLGNREVKTDLFNILDLLNCAEDYGFDKHVLTSSLVEIAGGYTDEDIKNFASRYLTPEAAAQGFTEEDYEQAIERLTEYKPK